MAIDPREARLKRMMMRSMRRGTKEMDILMMRFASAHLHELSDGELDSYDLVLDQNDQDLYQWVTGQIAAPPEIAPMIARISETAAADPVARRPFA
tara:strand:+ start:6775 stop:7062 length:288 start_codon:yes stop_codon:yes gene_type:complete